MTVTVRSALVMSVVLVGGCKAPALAEPSASEAAVPSAAAEAGAVVGASDEEEPVGLERGPSDEPSAQQGPVGVTSVARAACEEGEPMTVRFYDAGQALAALVTLPDGRHIMVDAGEAPDRAACGAPCKAWHRRVKEGLARDLGQDTVAMLWITHQHSDHLGGVPGLASIARPALYVDNGTDLTTRGVKKARAAATAAGAAIHVVDPSSPALPMQGDERVTLTPILPAQWPSGCTKAPNDCSIGLRIDYCRSSVLFVGDAEAKLEAAWSAEDIDLLQVGHHGSDTSSTQRFIDQVQPNYAVVSSADRSEGTNKTFCHPRLETVDRLTRALGGPGASTVEAFDGSAKCQKAGRERWKATPVSDRLWFTARDGEVVLVTTGDGVFARGA